MKIRNEFKRRIGKAGFLLGMILMLISTPTYAHCDSYDGPVIQDALKALDQKDIRPVLKWIEKDHEAEITSLFYKTLDLKKKDTEVYGIVEKHFLETLVRLHREGEGAPFTGLKPAGSTTPMINMADESIAKEDVDSLLSKLTTHLQKEITEKYEKVIRLSKVKENSLAEGRAYVAAYVEYTHTLEAIEGILAHKNHH